LASVQLTCLCPFNVENVGPAPVDVLAVVTVDAVDVPAIGSTITTVAAGPVVAATFSFFTM